MNEDEVASEREISPAVVYRLRTELGESLDSITEMPDEALQRAFLKLEQPDRARNRLEHEIGALLDDDSRIPSGSLATAHRQAAEVRAQEPPGQTCGLPTGGPMVAPRTRYDPMGPDPIAPDVEGVAPLAGVGPTANWSELGPDNIGGRTRSIVIDPNDSDRLYSGGVGGGVWRSTNGGASWHPTDDLMGNLAICSLVMSPNDSSRILAGSGEGFGNNDAIQGDGIFETADSGDSWTVLAATSNDPDFRFVNDLVYSADGTVLFAATNTGIHRSVDDGQSWRRAFSGVIGNIRTHPDDPLKAIAGTIGAGLALFTTDGGQSWQAAQRPPGSGRRRVQVCFAAADPMIAYASVEAPTSELWRSTDGGASYSAQTRLSGGAPVAFLGQQGWYDNIIWAGDPTDADLVLVGGIDLWRSTDGGDHLAQISTWWDNRAAHADHHAIVADPGYNGTTNRRVYFGNDGGVARADDVRTVGNNAIAPFVNGWVKLNNGYAVTQFFYGAGHIGTSTIIGGTQDNGSLRRTPSGGSSWNTFFGGDGGACASDQRDSQIWYGEYVYLNIFRNENGGADRNGSDPISGRFWDGFRRQWRWKSEPFVITDCRDQAAQFIAPFVLDPNDSDRLLGGARSLWLSTDPRTPNTTVSGPTWSTIKDPIGFTRSRTITALAVADGSSDVIVVGYANGEIHLSLDGRSTAPSWVRVDQPPMPSGRQCLGVTIDPDDHDIIYATFGGYTAGNFWKTIDGGQNWVDLSGTLPSAPIRSATLHPQRSLWVYVATEVGVFASEDGGHTWSATNQGPADVACRDLFWLGCDLVLATHGRGMFQIDLTISNAFPEPELVLAGSREVTANGQALTVYDLTVTNADAYPDSLFRPSPDLPPCGADTTGSRSWVDVFRADTDQRINTFCTLSAADDLGSLWFATPNGVDPPESVFIELNDRRCGQRFRSNEVTPAPPEPQPVDRTVTGADRRGGSGPIVRLGGPWGDATTEEVIGHIVDGVHRYYVGEGTGRAGISVVRSRSGPYLRTYGDATVANNLGDLPTIGN